MISFFRKIRQKLLSQNQVTRYLVYAVGEIFLVVIGILIALQINIWNQNRLDRIEANHIIKNLLVDLYQDTLEIEKVVQNLKPLLLENEILGEKINGPFANLDTFKLAAEKFNPIFYAPPTIPLITLNSIESTGRILLLSDTVRKGLLEYKTSKESVFEVIETNKNVYLERINQFSSTYKFGSSGSEYLKRLNDRIEDERQFANLLSSLIGYKNFYFNVSIGQLEGLKQKSMELIELLEENHK